VVLELLTKVSLVALEQQHKPVKAAGVAVLVRLAMLARQQLALVMVALVWQFLLLVHL
jgi:hypothetical protein